MRAILHRLHVRIRWLRFKSNEYDGLWRYLVVCHRMRRLARKLGEMDRTQPGWSPLPVKQTAKINVHDLTREELVRLLELGEKK